MTFVDVLPEEGDKGAAALLALFMGRGGSKRCPTQVLKFLFAYLRKVSPPCALQRFQRN